MKPQNNSYDFFQASTTGKDGFEIFQNEQDKFYYFHVNDMDGKVLLYSQAYVSEKNRDKGILSVQKNAPLENRYVIKNEGQGLHYFILKAGNHQEIARSRMFEALSDLEFAKEYMMCTEENPPVHNRTEKIETTTTTTTRKKNGTKAKKKKPKIAPEKSRLKQSFRIEWYPENSLGKIEHLVSGESLQFESIDGNILAEFILKQLPSNGEQHHTPVVENTEVNFNQFEKLSIRGTDERMRGPIVYRSNTYFLDLDLTDELKDEATDISITVWAKSVHHSAKMQVGELFGQAGSGNKWSVPLITAPLNLGPNRLDVQIQFHTAQETDKTLSGSRLVNVVEF